MLRSSFSEKIFQTFIDSFAPRHINSIRHVNLAFEYSDFRPFDSFSNPSYAFKNVNQGFLQKSKQLREVLNKFPTLNGLKDLRIQLGAVRDSRTTASSLEDIIFELIEEADLGWIRKFEVQVNWPVNEISEKDHELTTDIEKARYSFSIRRIEGSWISLLMEENLEVLRT